MKKLHAKFRVYPKGHWFYFDVFVWNRRADMRQALKDENVYEAHNCDGCCCSHRLLNISKNGKSRMTGLLGQIHFHAKAFSMGVITHECTHAAIAWAQVKGVNPMAGAGEHGLASKDEEAFCWVLGNIARQVVLKTDRQWKFQGAKTREVTPYT